MDEDYYVAPCGSDSNPGSIDRPFKTIARAQAKVHESAGRGKRPITIHLQGGVYYLKDTVVFSAKDSGAPDAVVTYSAYKGEKVVISGGSKLKPDWRPYRDGILQAEMPAGLEFDQLFVGGKRQHMARYPTFDPNKQPYNGFAGDAFSPERAARWADPAGGYIHAMHKSHWGGYHYLIIGKNPDNTIVYKGGWQNNRQMGMHPEHRFVENIFEELDSPGEWFHNRKTSILYYYPLKDMDIKSSTIEVAGLRHLIEFQGRREYPVTNITLSGLTFQHAARTFMETREPLLRSDWTIYRGGAITINGAKDCLVTDCEFDQVGGNAVFVNNYNRRITVRGTHIHGAGASGICFVGDPQSVRNPLFEYHQEQSYADIDKEAGPKSDNHPSDCLVDDCLIHGISVVEKQAAGIQISMSKGITVRHCSIYDVGRAGININEGTFGGHCIEFCDVFDTVRETGDHGSFNSWGRDRFWHLKDALAGDLPWLALLDAEKTVIRNSRWRCDHGWDVDLDDGSSNYEIYNNLFLNGGLKLREGFHRHVYNNIAINNSLHPHVWYGNSMDVITNNIWMSKYWPVEISKWGMEVDRNMFTSEDDRNAFTAQGCDAHSIAGDPMFVDPRNGDYSLKPKSPALKIGFKNFPMTMFGVRKPDLKAIARVPVFPMPKMAERGSTAVDGHARKWQGASVRELIDQEFSAFGVSKENGGIKMVAVPVKSRAAKAGFKAGDIIQSVDGKGVKTIAGLRMKTRGKGGHRQTIGFVRNQKEQTLALETREEKIARVIAEEVDIVPYDHRWPDMFEQERIHLLSCLPNELIRKIEHFGSTAIPGFSAKPIVDMLVEVASLDDTRQRIAPVLETQGYDYFWRPTWGNDTPPFYAWFIKRNSAGKRTHHIHMVEAGFEHWDRLLFRDYLIEFPEIAGEYGELKTKLSDTHRKNRVLYTEEKGAFIRAITQRAKEYYGTTHEPGK